MAVLAEIGQQQIAQHRADIEAHGPDEGEFGIDHAAVALGHHHRAGMEIAMDQRFGRGEEFVLEPRDGELEGDIGAELGGDAVELGRGPAVALGDAIGIGEDQILGDLAELGIAGEDRRQRLLLAGRQREIAGHEQAIWARYSTIWPAKAG